MKILIIGSARHGEFKVLIDDEDLDLVTKYRWRVHKWRHIFYAQAWIWNDGKSTTIVMHRLIMAAKKIELIDHIDGDGLNNQKANLRKCSNTQNCWNQKIAKNNTTGFRGVSLNRQYKRKSKYRSRIRVNDKLIGLGDFDTAIEAAKAYNEAAKIYFGEFARLNPIPCVE